MGVVLLVIDVDLIAVKDCCVACIGKFCCAHEGRFGDAGGDVYVSPQCVHVGGEFADLSGFLCGPVGQEGIFYLTVDLFLQMGLLVYRRWMWRRCPLQWMELIHQVLLVGAPRRRGGMCAESCLR